MYGEVEMQILLFGLLLQTKPLNSSEFSSDFANYEGQTGFFCQAKYFLIH